MDVIELWSGGTKALVDIEGAWLTNLSDDKGDVLFPKRKLAALDGSKKVRGGSHVCLPNFGPGGLSGQPQHGYGRTSLWTVARQTQAEVTLELPQGSGGYEAMSSTLTYRLEDCSVMMTLKVINNGSERLRVAPGFHPYFRTQDDEGKVIINDQSYDLQDLAGTEFVTGDSLQVVLERRTVTLMSTELTTWALWTDQLSGYVCCEPTLGGYRFEADEPQDDEWVEPGQTRTYAATIRWS